MKLPSRRSRRSSDEMRDLYKNVNVHEMFDTIVPTYDFLNHFFSFNIDRAWRRRMIRAAEIPSNANVLDVCTGTGDALIDLLRLHPDARATGVDFAEAMIERARQKLAERGMAERVELAVGNAEALPVAGGTYDAAMVAFGLRNVGNRETAIREMARSVRSGGNVLVLEFAPPPETFFGNLYAWYLRNIMPAIGERLSNYPDTYAYLYSSIAAFYRPPELAAVMTRAGLRDARFWKLSGGIAYLHRGTKG